MAIITSSTHTPWPCDLSITDLPSAGLPVESIKSGSDDNQKKRNLDLIKDTPFFLPPDMLKLIFLDIGIPTLGRLSCCNRNFTQFFNSSDIWKPISQRVAYCFFPWTKEKIAERDASKKKAVDYKNRVRKNRLTLWKMVTSLTLRDDDLVRSWASFRSAAKSSSATCADLLISFKNKTQKEIEESGGICLTPSKNPSTSNDAKYIGLAVAKEDHQWVLHICPGENHSFSQKDFEELMPVAMSGAENHGIIPQKYTVDYEEVPDHIPNTYMSFERWQRANKPQ